MALRFLLCVPLVAASLPVSFAASPADQPAPAKTHVLFMGADLDVQREKKFYRVRDVVGSEFMIRIGQKEFFVPTRTHQTALKVGYGLKLTAAEVKLDGLEAGPGYTPANDPGLKFNRESGAAGGAAAVQDLAYGQMISAGLSASLSSAAANAPNAQPGAIAADAAAQARLSAATAGFDVANQMTMQDQYSAGVHADRLAKDQAEGNYDAVEASFKISSPVELDDPYMVLLFKFQERDAKTGQEGMLIHAKALEPIGPKPKYIRVREGGMPRGFKYLDCQIHIYNHGQEVATNVSPQRVELTRDDAREYLLIEHLGAHKKDTVIATAVTGTLPRTRRAELSTNQLNRTLYVKISADARLLGVYQDETCQQPLDDQVTVAACGDLFFQPALEQGKPVEGIARVRLGDI
jgi:hypothetical protein